MEQEYRKGDLLVLPDPLATKRASPFRLNVRDYLPVGESKAVVLNDYYKHN